jgi:hypothetical protein
VFSASSETNTEHSGALREAEDNDQRKKHPAATIPMAAAETSSFLITIAILLVPHRPVGGKFLRMQI